MLTKLEEIAKIQAHGQLAKYTADLMVAYNLTDRLQNPYYTKIDIKMQLDIVHQAQNVLKEIK